MRAIDVLTNLKNYDCWDFKKYPLSKEEAEVIIKELEKLERPKGEWIFKNNNRAIPTGYYECSRCGVGKLLIRGNFCPACGAEMR